MCLDEVCKATARIAYRKMGTALRGLPRENSTDNFLSTKIISLEEKEGELNT